MSNCLYILDPGQSFNNVIQYKTKLKSLYIYIYIYFYFYFTDVTTKEELLRKMHQIKSKLHKTANGTNPRVKRQIEQTAREDSEVITSTSGF